MKTRTRHLLSSAAFTIALACVVGCTGSSDDEGVVVTLKSDEAVTLSKGSTATITLWGYDRDVADTPATVLERVSAPVEALPATVAMPAVKDAASRVGGSSVCYYVTVAFDVDGDSQICAGDLRVDEGRASLQQTCSIGDVEKEFFLQRVPSGEACQPISK